MAHYCSNCGSKTVAKKDYVKRGKPAQRSRKKPAPKRKPIKPVLLAILVASGFGYALYLLNQDPEPEVTPPIAEKPAPKAAPQKPAAELPPIPEEEWDYIKTLPEKEVQVEAKELAVSDVPYIMQCGAYKTMSTAQERKMDIAFQGINSQIKKREDSSWYRVVLGPYERKRDAEKDKHKLQRAKIEPCAIWKDNGQ
jgi:cell division protein FtsN